MRIHGVSLLTAQTRTFTKDYARTMRGDILFYTPTDWIGSLVAWATNGPFCHVAIDMGDGTKIEADSNGIVRVSQDARTIGARFNTAKEAPQLEQGMIWLQAQLATPTARKTSLTRCYG